MKYATLRKIYIQIVECMFHNSDGTNTRVYKYYLFYSMFEVESRIGYSKKVDKYDYKIPTLWKRNCRRTIIWIYRSLPSQSQKGEGKHPRVRTKNKIKVTTAIVEFK